MPKNKHVCFASCKNPAHAARVGSYGDRSDSRSRNVRDQRVGCFASCTQSTNDSCVGSYGDRS